MLSFSVYDHSGHAYFSGFNEVGQQILGISADELQAMREQDQDAYMAEVSKAHGSSWFFNVRAKAESYGDQTRVRYNVQRLQKFDYSAAGHALMEDIRSYGV